jgi:hypothetical protein
MGGQLAIRALAADPETCSWDQLSSAGIGRNKVFAVPPHFKQRRNKYNRVEIIFEYLDLE